MRFTLNTILTLTATLTPAVLAGPHGPHGGHRSYGHSHGGNYCSQPINENLMQLTGEANDNAHFCSSLSTGLLSNDVDVCILQPTLQFSRCGREEDNGMREETNKTRTSNPARTN